MRARLGGCWGPLDGRESWGEVIGSHGFEGIASGEACEGGVRGTGSRVGLEWWESFGWREQVGDGCGEECSEGVAGSGRVGGGVGGVGHGRESF